MGKVFELKSYRSKRKRQYLAQNEIFLEKFIEKLLSEHFNTNFVELQRELSDTENKIQAARRFYNSVVIELQNALEQFPTNLIGKSFGFKTRDFFELAEGEQAARNPVKVSF